ncbi:hypothetical protein [Pseudorhodobacter turbinis]|uniref:hypothetical protein n=1 Tax=Pseudorhodobacter turbinis TaxID=2500533 RepID=UPI001F0DBB60|nr:hypothetical protein [Pseudorhodobacter turbinis]
MITFHPLSNDHPDLVHSPLLRAALLTLQYTQKHGSIGLTKTKAFKRVFVQWAVEHFDWPGSSAEEMFRYNKVINEHEFPPLEVLHYLLVTLRLGRHFKGEFRLPALIIAPNANRGLKSLTAKRDLPLHPQLVDLGLIDHAARQIARHGPQADLFLDLRPRKGSGFGGQLDYRFRKLVQTRLNGNPEGKVFHSLRHYVATQLGRIADLPEAVRKDIRSWRPRASIPVSSGPAAAGYFKNRPSFPVVQHLY